MPEGDTIHRVARRFEAALVGKEILAAAAPNGRSPLHRRASELAGRTLESAEAYGKHLLLSFSGGLVVHSHLGVNGRWFVRADGRPSYGKPWLELAAGPAIASQSGGKILRMTSAGRARNDPVLLQLGPDPLRPGYDQAAATSRLLAYEPAVPVGEALLDQSLIAGVGNVIRIEACFIPGVSPWRPVGELTRRRGRRDRRREQLGDGDVARDRTPAEADLRPRPPSLREVRRPDHDPWAG